MLGRSVFVLLVLCSLVTPNISEEREFTIYETVESIISQGYHAESHQVITEDGYILEMHRIPHKRGSSESPADRPVVIVMHGFLTASNCFTILGANYSIAYHLADAGFDVWLGNARGNKNSRHHVTLNPDDPNEKFDFFDFTFEQIGMYDVAAMVDYVLEHTGMKNLHYIGHSQGGTAFLILNSLRTEYNAKFASAHLLAGVGYVEYFPDPISADAAILIDVFYNMARRFGFVELYPPSSTGTCAGNANLDFICELIGIGDHLESNLVAGAALKQFVHFGQNLRDQKFRRWNYGNQENLIVYGTSAPPDYDLSLINVNVTMHYTVSDHVLDERDVLAMIHDMPLARARKVARETFLHDDFILSEDAKELVTDYIIDAISYVHDNDANEDMDSIPEESVNFATKLNCNPLILGIIFFKSYLLFK